MGYVGKVTAGGSTHLVGSTLYGTCSTGAGTAAKVVACTDFTTLFTGVTIHVKFTYSNTASNATLNVNSTGAKNLCRYGTTRVGTTTKASWQAGAVVSFTYDGTSWVMDDYIEDTDTTYSDVVAGGNSGLMSGSDKTKLNGIATGATANSPSSTSPKMDGTASTGSESAYSRGDHVHPTDTSRAPVSHASTSTTYGSGTDSNYGHVKLSDSTSGTAAAASGGTAATPKAVSDALAAANSYTDTAIGGISAGVTGVKGNAESSYRTGDVNLTPANIGAAASSHAHGNITSSGDITATAPTVASGDKIIINDESASKITNGPSFGTSTTTYLRNDGSWGTPAGSYSLPTASSSTKGGVTLSDATNGTDAAASGGKAATPKAVSDALAAAKTYADNNDSDTTYTLGTTGSGSSRKVTLTAGGSGSGTQSIDVPDTDTTYSEASQTSPGLMSSADKTKLDGISANPAIYRAICPTAASTTAKVATLDNATGFNLMAGVTVAVRFQYGNSATTPTLNVNSTGAKTIAIAKDATTFQTGDGTTYNSWGAYETLIFTYTGSYWAHVPSGRLGYLAYSGISAKANIASPTFTGTPAAPTAATGTSTTQIATTAFVHQEFQIMTDSEIEAICV